jgi:integrase
MTGKRRCAELLRAKSLSALPPGWHADGRGLYLLVSTSGSRRWILRTLIKGGRRCEIGLGSLHDVGIDEAREKAAELRRAARAGRDPIIERRARAESTVTFRQAFQAFFVMKRRSLSNAKHLAQWPSTMEAYVFPFIGERPVNEIASGEVLAILEPIWHDKPETAKRVLQRMVAVFESAILHNWRERASPCIGVVQALGGTGHRVVRHHRALPYEKVPTFLKLLHDSHALPETKLAFEWLVLTATRSGETRGATWSEMDQARALWVIPSYRMKGTPQARREHRVPLSARCLEILAAARALNPDSEFVFANHRTGKALSDMAFTKILRTLGLGAQATAHGFRSSFRDWATEVDGVREVVSEAALAHSVRDKTEGAYRRAAYLEERRELMARWAAYLRANSPNSSNAVINSLSPAPALH